MSSKNTNPFLKDFFFLNSDASAPISTNLDISQPKKSDVYADYAAATPPCRLAYNAVVSSFASEWENASSLTHVRGQDCYHSLESSRSYFISAFGSSIVDVVFMSCASEANQTLIHAVIRGVNKRNQVVCSPSEHASIIAPLKTLDSHGIVSLQFLQLDANGQVDLSHAKKIINEQTALVCLMDVNNETGVMQSTHVEVAKHSKKVGALLHMDAVQGLARNSGSLQNFLYDSATISSGKIYGPKGAAALLINKDIKRLLIKNPLLVGGGQENAMRAGTVNLPLIKGFESATKYILANQTFATQWLKQLEDIFWTQLKTYADIPFHQVASQHRVPGLFTIVFENCNAQKLLLNCSQLCLSSGSACKSVSAQGSHVLSAYGYPIDVSVSGMRISFGLPNTPEDARLIADALAKNVRILQDGIA